jgi:DNA-directed RNA polymerase subunit RPC12/RpoP
MSGYVCPRCGSSDTYSSEENGRTFAVTLDTPGPVDPTVFHTMKETVTRCKNCGEKPNYIYSAVDLLKNSQNGVKIGWTTGLSFGFVGLSLIVLPLFLSGELFVITNWIGGILVVLSALALLTIPLHKARIRELNKGSMEFRAGESIMFFGKLVLSLLVVALFVGLMISNPDAVSEIGNWVFAPFLGDN